MAGEPADLSQTDLNVPSLDELWPSFPGRSGQAAANVDVDFTHDFDERPTPAAPPVRPVSFTQDQSIEAPDVADAIPAGQNPSAISSGPSNGAARTGGSRADQLVQLAAARGATALYLWSNCRPSVRIDGEMHPLDTIPVFGPEQIETMLLSLRFAHGADTREALAAAEWKFDVPQVGEVRCTKLQDHRGPAAMFTIARTLAQPASISSEIEALARHRHGLVLVTGPRSSGKEAIVSRLVDLFARTHRGYVISIHRDGVNRADGESPLISRREARGSLDEMLAAARAALRESPDVLAIEEVGTLSLMNLALDAAASGVLVVAGLTGPTGIRALEHIVDLYAPEQERTVQLALAQCLRAVVGQVLVPDTANRRTAAQEVVLNVGALRTLLAAGKARNLHLGIDAGRKYGTVTLNDALIDLVRTGAVRAEDAYRHAPEQAAFLEALTAQGIDTSFLRRP